MGNRVGEEATEPIATISVDGKGRLSVAAHDPEVHDALLALIARRMQAGGFMADVGRYEPSEEQPEAHVSYAIKRNPGDAHFDWALDSVFTRYWTGERVGQYEIDGFASYVDSVD